MIDTAILGKAGLTGNEIKVYLSLIELGSVSAGEVIKKAGLHRAATYDAIERLLEKGLVSYVIKAHRKYFEAASAKRLIDVVERQEDKLKAEKNTLLDLIPILESKRSLAKEPQEVTVFKGNKGLKSIFQDWLEEKKEILVIGAYTEEAESLKYHMKYTLPGFHNRRIKQKQIMKYIFPQQSILRAKQLAEYAYTPVRILKVPFASLTSIQIYGDKTAIIVWLADPIGIVIRSAEVAKSYRDYFEVLWNISQPINKK